MMRYLTALFILTTILLVSCTSKEVKIEYNDAYKDPISAFDYSGNNGPAPVEIQFNNYSQTLHPDSVSYLWKFGEHGPESNDKNPTHTFHNNTSQPKTELIILTVFDLISDRSQTKSQVIVIEPAE